jgi:glycosyltransferase involved in cell wall biosynthesis
VTIRLIAVATHPVQYQAPYFRGLAAQTDIDLHVLYALLPTPDEQGVGFERSFAWDVPLLDGYCWDPIEGVERREAGASTFSGLSAPRIRAQLEQTVPGAVLVTGWQSKVLVQAARAARALRIPVLLRGESNDLRRRPLWVRVAHRWYFRKFSAFLAIGKANRRLYESAGVPLDRIFEVPYAVDNERFGQAAASLRPRRTELRQGWNVDGSTFCVLFAGKLQAKKRPGDLLDALEVARKSHGDLRLLVAGSGELESELKQKARERRLPVTFAGFLNQSQMPMAYAAADALVLPSDAGETWGLVVNEAMASGLPAIVSDRVGCREDLVIDGATGFSFSMGDVRAMAACITSLAADPIRASAMGEVARQRVEQGYSISCAVRGTLAALEFLKWTSPGRE